MEPPARLTSAFHLIRRSTVALCPPLDARVKGVYSSLLWTFGDIPVSKIATAQSMLPLPQAKNKPSFKSAWLY